MELHAPGADIVGFEYSAETAQDRAKVDAAVAMLARPLDLFALPEAAGCSVAQASMKSTAMTTMTTTSTTTTTMPMKSATPSSTPHTCLSVPTPPRPT